MLKTVNCIKHKCMQCGRYARWVETEDGLQCECGSLLTSQQIDEFSWY